MNITIRKAKLGDEKILAYIHTESWKSAFADIISAEDNVKNFLCRRCPHDFSEKVIFG